MKPLPPELFPERAMNNGNEFQAYLEAPHQADILIVDDTLENIWLLAKILEAQGYSVRKAISGEMAWTAVASTPPDLILLDICMPDLDGYALCRRLKAHPPTANIPVIFLSALHEALDKVKAFEVGGVDYITKPFQAAEVLVRTRNQLMVKNAWTAVHEMNLRLEAQVQERTQALEVANRRLLELAYRDELTGLPNRTLLMERLAQSLELMRTDPDYQFAVLFLDCDRFKLINDSFGHLVGDDLLVRIAQRLAPCLRPEDTLARFGGDEFVVVSGRIESPQDAIAIAQCLIDVLKPSVPLDYTDVFISASIGIVLSNPIQHQRPEHILRDADIAMYCAKSGGKDRYCIFNPTMHRASLELLQVGTDLHQAVDQAEFVPFYQPIVDLATGKLSGLEVLARWQHPKRGILLPHTFMSIAEETGLIVPIGKALLETACQQLAHWRSQNLVSENFYISFNLSVCQITQAFLPQCLQQTLMDYGLTPNQIRLEITETALLDNDLAKAVITQLDDQGFHLCIDDFGVGYSSLSYLHQFPITTLKIDRSFIQNIQLRSRNFKVVTAILSIAKTLQMAIVAEGIETADQLAILREIGCELGQGYLFSNPCPAESMTEILTQKLQW
jgi:diguanylate cyclase (GGDEF)-like protein